MAQYQNNRNNNQGNNNQNNRKPQQQQQKRKPTPNNPDIMSNARLMGREGMKAIRDIAHERYNIYENGHVFRNPEFVKATIAELDKRLLKLSVHINAIKYAYANTTDQVVLSVLNRDMRENEAYVLCRDVLMAILQTNDAGMLYSLASRLPAYKHNI